MKWAVAVVALSCVLTVNVSSQPNDASPDKNYRAQPECPPSITLEHNNITNNYAEQPNADPPKWYTPLERPDWWLVAVGIGAILVGRSTLKDISKQTRLLRKYVK